MTTITVEHASKQFQRDGLPPVLAVDDVSLKINTGDVLAIIGPSGCGKSTLLRLIAGLYKPDSGRVLYDNVPVEDVHLSERGIGMVFQDNALIPHWEARRSVGFFLRLRQREYEVPERMKRISKITGIGIEHLMGRMPKQLSGGERQRVSIARALARDLNVLLFDEPFANIDQKLRVEARVELKRLLNEFPVTAVYVTHDQTEAVALSHRIAVMRDGHLEQLGTYNTLHDNPINRFVASFVGTPTINFFEGFARGGEWHGDNFGGYAFRSDLPDGTRVTMGVRPEYGFLSEGGVPAVVEAATPYYAERFLLLDVHLAGERWSLQVPLDTPISVGETVYSAWEEAGLLFFDGETGVRIG